MGSRHPHHLNLDHQIRYHKALKSKHNATTFIKLRNLPISHSQATKMSESQRKVELQSPEDLRYLINNAKRAASEKIDRAFPPMPNQGEDAMKIRVQELVDEVSS